LKALRSNTGRLRAGLRQGGRDFLSFSTPGLRAGAKKMPPSGLLCAQNEELTYISPDSKRSAPTLPLSYLRTSQTTVEILELLSY